MDVKNRTLPLLFEQGSEGRRGYEMPACDVPEVDLHTLLPAAALRNEPPALPELSELETIRHFVRLSQRNYAIDTGFYPLGSCTMKYNPKMNEQAAALPGFSRVHPHQPIHTIQGALALMYHFQQALVAISGLDQASLQPAAGAQGELVGLMIMRAYHDAAGQTHRDEIICPDSAHGTNPASAAMCGYKIVQVPSDARGGMDVEALRAAVNERTAGLMLTNPNTLGLFDENIAVITQIIREAGGLLYYDGANSNAIMGYSRPGDMGFDIVHFNLHKTFSTPHGGGGPGAGPVVVRDHLARFLPVPTVEKGEGGYYLHYDRPDSVGRVHGFYGNFGVLVRAYAYIRRLGAEGLRRVSEHAVLHANYVLERLKPYFHVPYNRLCMHEFVISGKKQRPGGVRTLDMAKRLLDYGVHAPTIYFPLIVEEALMIEPTETESLQALDEFIDALIAIAEEAREQPDVVQNAPHTTVVKRLDEARAARELDVRWRADP